MTDYTGKLVFLDESSNSGGWWAFVPDNTYLDYPNDTYILQSGDVLTILNADGTSTLWTGTINLSPYPLDTESVHGFWIRTQQSGVPITTWALYFISGLPAKLTTTNQVINPEYSDPPT